MLHAVAYGVRVYERGSVWVPSIFSGRALSKGGRGGGKEGRGEEGESLVRSGSIIFLNYHSEWIFTSHGSVR